LSDAVNEHEKELAVLSDRIAELQHNIDNGSLEPMFVSSTVDTLGEPTHEKVNIMQRFSGKLI